MRIPKFPHNAHTGVNLHKATMPLPVTPPLVSAAGWMVFFMPGPAYVFGKFSSGHVETEGMWNTLFGHDWGPAQPHICVLPPTHAPSPETVTVALGSSHKFWLPSYAVKEPAGGGALALIAGSSTSAVAVCFPDGIICLQDCQDNNGIAYVLPFGINMAAPTTHWVGFGASDFFAGLAALAGDCLGAVLLSKLTNGSLLGRATPFSKYGDISKAFIGMGIGVLGSALSGLASLAGAPTWLQFAAGVGLVILDVLPFRPDHTGPAGAGLVGGAVADWIGGGSGPTGEYGQRDPFFGPPLPAADGGPASASPPSGQTTSPSTPGSQSDTPSPDSGTSPGTGGPDAGTSSGGDEPYPWDSDGGQSTSTPAPEPDTCTPGSGTSPGSGPADGGTGGGGSGGDEPLPWDADGGDPNTCR